MLTKLVFAIEKEILFKINNKSITTFDIEFIFLNIRGKSVCESVDVVITRLRKKIEDSPKNPKYLQNIRGEGYVLLIE